MKKSVFLWLALVLGGHLCQLGAADSNGAMWGAVIERTGNYATPGITVAPTTVWTRNLTQAIDTTPATSATRVYVVTREAILYALDRSDGTTVWQQQLQAPAHSSPALDEVANRLFIGAGDSLYAFNATTGALLWVFPTTGIVLSSPAVSNDVVYVSSTDHQVLALNSVDGSVVWTHTQTQPVSSSPCIGTVENLVFINGDNGEISALNLATGAVVWSVERIAPMFSSPALSAGTLYVADGLGQLLALNAVTGTVIWEVTLQTGYVVSPSIAHGLIYTNSLPNTLAAFDPLDGTEVWQFDAGSSIWARVAVTTDVSTSQNAVYLSAVDGTLHGLDPTNGTQLWSFQVEGGLVSTPTVNSGQLFIGTSAGVVYALQ